MPLLLPHLGIDPGISWSAIKNCACSNHARYYHLPGQVSAGVGHFDRCKHTDKLREGHTGTRTHARTQTQTNTYTYTDTHTR